MKVSLTPAQTPLSNPKNRWPLHSLQTDRIRQVVSYQLHLNNNTSLLSSTPPTPLQTPNKMGCSSSKPATGPKSATASSTKKAVANKEGKKFDSDYKRGSTVSFILTTSSDDGERERESSDDLVILIWPFEWCFIFVNILSLLVVSKGPRRDHENKVKMYGCPEYIHWRTKFIIFPLGGLFHFFHCAGGGDHHALNCLRMR